jgi:amino acid adenylation domain-containing protein
MTQRLEGIVEGSPLGVKAESLSLASTEEQRSHLKNGPCGNLGWAFHFEGVLDQARIRSAIAAVIRGHVALHSGLHQVCAAPQQQHEGWPHAFEPELADISSYPKHDRETALARLCDEALQTPVDAQSKAPFLRIVLARLASDQHALILTSHPAMLDAPSRDLFIINLVEAYAGRAVKASNYLDYAVWQRKAAEGYGRVLESHWRENFLAGAEALDMPIDVESHSSDDPAAWKAVQITWPSCLTGALKHYAAARNVSPDEIVLAAHAALLSRDCRQADLAFGRVLDNRRPDDEHVLGNFGAIVPFRITVAPHATFCELVSEASSVCALIESKRRLPYYSGECAEDLTWSSSSCLRVAAAAEPGEFAPGVAVRCETLAAPASPFQITIEVEIGSCTMLARANYRSNCFTAACARRILEHLGQLLADGLNNPGKKISQLATMTEAERKFSLFAWNSTVSRIQPTTIVDDFEAQVSAYPKRLAVADESGGALTYAELRSEANRIANHLLHLGVKCEQRCAIFLDRSLLMPLATLGVLKSGGAYVPIDLATPRERIAEILNNAGVVIVLTDRVHAERLPEGPWRVWTIDEGAAANESDSAPDVEIQPECLAYVMYTSGSTGHPKGVLIEHRAVTAFVRGVQKLYALTPDDVFMQFASVGFDVTTFELFCAWLTGSSVHVAAVDTRRSLERLRRLMRERRISLFMGTPGILELLEPTDFPDLRMLAVGGEPFGLDLVKRWLPGRRFLNSYGPTEATVAVVAYEFGDPLQSPSLIGRAMPNHRAYVLDEQLQPVPIGVKGELCIGGPGVARGYLGLPGRTAEAFVPDPYGDEPGARLYRTGDLVRWLSSGQILFVGRVDRQVKIRGMRVELGEVEGRLRMLPNVRQGIAQIVADSDLGGRLVAYIVPRDNTSLNVGTLRDALSRLLPSHMVPSEIISVNEIPLGATGKIDWDALAEERARQQHSGRIGRATLSPTERLLIEKIVRPIVGLRDLDPGDDLFDLGVDSLRAIQIVAAIEDLFQVELPVNAFFDSPSVVSLAAVIDGMPQQAAPTTR